MAARFRRNSFLGKPIVRPGFRAEVKRPLLPRYNARQLFCHPRSLHLHLNELAAPKDLSFFSQPPRVI